MQITSASRRKKPQTLATLHPGAELIDVTSQGPHPWVELSPFYPHGGIPVPFTPGVTSMSVEGVWQGLKVFETADVAPAKFELTGMKGVTRSTRKRGRCLGHRRGVKGAELLDAQEARWQIFLPSYYYQLKVAAAAVVEDLRQLASQEPVVLLDYETNGDIEDLSRPLSHAALIIRFLMDDWPTRVEPTRIEPAPDQDES